MFGTQKAFNPLVTIIRNVSTKKPYVWRGEGIQYPGFVYYPRRPDFKDPSYEPTKLFRVQRIKTMKGIPYWEKDILQRMGLAGERCKSDVVILKNIPEVCKHLWRVKHLVEIQPVTFPNGFPKDNRGTYLKENGELLVKKELAVCESSLAKTDNFMKDPKRLDGATLKRNSELKWLSGWSGNTW